MRRTVAQVAGPVPALQRVEHAGRVGARDERGEGHHRFASLGGSSEVVALAQVDAQDFPRIPTLIGEFDRVLGGGLVEGGVVLIGGDPGIGKSTLLLQAAARLAEQVPILYVTRRGVDAAGRASRAAPRPERLEGAALRRDRAGEDPGDDRGHEAARGRHRFHPDALFRSAHLGARARWHRCANARRISRASPSRAGRRIIFVGHVTKEGALAGPRVLEHMVDTVLYFEGDTHTSFRLIRAFKNRFGAVNEIGVFAMTEKGLREVTNPSALFLSQHHTRRAPARA